MKNKCGERAEIEFTRKKVTLGKSQRKKCQSGLYFYIFSFLFLRTKEYLFRASLWRKDSTKPVARKRKNSSICINILASLKGNGEEIKSLLTCFAFYFRDFELKFRLIVFRSLFTESPCSFEHENLCHRRRMRKGKCVFCKSNNSNYEQRREINN